MLNTIRRVFFRTDWILLGLCIVTSVFGIFMIRSATNLNGSGYYVLRQALSLGLGLILYFIISAVDMEFLAEHMLIMVAVAALFLAALYPFGYADDTGNKSWLSVPGLPFMLQPAEYCKIVYIIAIARIMTIYREHINSIPCIIRIGAVSALFLGLILVISKDAGVALIYVFSFIIMALTGGFSILWFLGGIAALVTGFPIVWNSGLIRDDQKNRLLVLFDESVDPLGNTIRYQAKRSTEAIANGGLLGKGYMAGPQTQANTIPAQRTDFIFAVIGEELGFVGCIFCIILLLAIVLRIIYIGTRTESYFYRQICIGIAGTFIFQILINVGMNLGVAPVIGVTLPFISYGGSSMLSLFIAIGVISSIRVHPSPDTQERYIQLPVA